MPLNKIKNYLLLLRPYSLVDLLTVFLLSRFMAAGAISYGVKDFLVFLSFLAFWGFLTWGSDARHRHPYREKIDPRFPYLLLVFPAVISLAYNPLALFLGFVIWIFAIFYMRKNEPGIFGSTSFISRGLYQSFLFLFGTFLYANNISMTSVFISLLIFCLYAARNLVGDIRDAEFDKHTFPVKHGIPVSYYTTVLFYLMATGILYYSFQNIFLLYPVLLMISFTLFFKNAYALHRCALALTTFLMVEVIFINDYSTIVFLNILLTSVLFNLIFYDLIPRPSNPKEGST